VALVSYSNQIGPYAAAAEQEAGYERAYKRPEPRPRWGAIAVGRIGCACGAQQAQSTRVVWTGAGVALVCLLSLKPLGLSGAASFLCVVLPRRGCVQSTADFCEGGVRGTGPSVDFESWIDCWCVCTGVGIGGNDGSVW
jgi:hypothetical protein